MAAAATATQGLNRTTARMPKTPIPIVNHIIPDEAVGIQKVVPRSSDLARVVKLLTDPYSENLIERHLHALTKLAAKYHRGFLMRDLVLVFKVLNVCADRIPIDPSYVEPMCQLLQICSYPFLKEKTSDETAYAQIVVESISQMGYLMRVPNNKIRVQLCQSLVSFYCDADKYVKSPLEGLKPSTKEYNIKVVEKSDVAETLVKSLALLESDLEVKLNVLKVLQCFSVNSDSNCDQMLSAEAAYRICSRLNDPDPSGQLMFRCTECLWNLVERGDNQAVKRQLNNLTCTSSLRDAFCQQLTKGHSHYDRQLRNDLLVLATLVAQSKDTHFIETGYAKELVLFTTFSEVKSHNPLVRNLKLETNHEDFELKKLLMNIMVLLSRDSAFIPIMSEGRLLLALFHYIKGNESQLGPRDWSPAQFEELQLQAMATLCTVGPLMIEDYMTCQGNTRLLLLLEWCVGTEDFGGHGNSFHGTGGRGNKRAQMRHCLRLLRSMVSVGDETIHQDLCDQGAMSLLLNILSTACQHMDEDDTIDVEMQCDMLFIVSALCEGDMHRKELFGSQGVNIVVQYLKTDPEKLNSGLGHNRLLLATVDCAWCAIIGSFQTEDLFLEKEGVFLLYDLLEVCPKNMQNVVLGCILDLCENPKTMVHINTWRGKKDRSAPNLLIEIWRTEESEMGVRRGPDGIIVDVTQPLAGTLQEQQGVIPLPANCPSQAIVDVSENMRAKLYALFCKIGFNDLPGMSTEDYVTLAVIERYLDFKVGEVWKEIRSELDQEGIQPTTADHNAVETITRAADERAKAVAQTQMDLLDNQQQQDLMDEQEMYAKVRDNHRQREKAIASWEHFVARTSNYHVLKEAKMKQEMSIEASRIQTRHQKEVKFHHTEVQNLNTTTFCGRSVQVNSTPVELTGARLKPYNIQRDMQKAVTLSDSTTIIS
ncbi:Cilia and flagella associated protein 69 [Branchiostoma belcheri]|nr:Cilia and flagella associated protein 69 [Branchiostoma belcheri]